MILTAMSAIYQEMFGSLVAQTLKLGQVAEVVKGKQVNGTELLEQGDYYVMNGGTLPSGWLYKYNTEANTISISEGGNSCGYVQYNTSPYWSGGHCYSLKILHPQETSDLYLYHFLKWQEENIMALRIGSGLPNIQKKDLLHFPVILPTITQQNKIVLILSAILTYVIPAGSYSKLSYNEAENTFVVTNPQGESTKETATQNTLDKLGIKINLSKFTDGSINKPIAIPNTYEKVSQNPQGISKIIEAPIQGTYDTIDIIMFVLIIGGVIGVLNATGAFNAGIASLSKITKGKEYILIILLSSNSIICSFIYISFPKKISIPMSLSFTIFFK